MGRSAIIDVLNRIRGPFNLSTTQLDVAEAAVRDQDYVARCRAENTRMRTWLAEALAELGVPSDTSMANFVLARFASPDEAEACDAFLQAQGLIVRRVAGYKLPHCLRITIGDEASCRRVAHAVAQFKGSAMTVIYNRVALIGLGLIASSMAHAMRAGGLAGEIVGYARIGRDAGRWRWRSGSATGSATRRPRRCRAPTSWCWRCRWARWGRLPPRSARIWRPGATVTDVGSVKQAVIDGGGAASCPPGVHFIPGHPMAGTEYSGPRSGFATLFQNRWWLLTPVPEQPTRRRWPGCARCCEAMGAKVDEMDAAHHDLVLAVVSHTPAPDRLYDGGRGRSTCAGSSTVRGHQVFRRRVSAISPASRPATRRCGATCS